jgi:type VI secretion system secreted protein VgrG
MATYLQSDRRLVIRTPLPEHTLLLAGFSGVEAMSEPFMFHLDLRSEEQWIDPNDIVGQPVSFGIRMMWPKNSAANIRWFHGIVRRFTHHGRSDRLSRFSAEVVPMDWLLARRADARIYQAKKTADIVTDVLKRGGVASIETKLKESYSPREYCVQYRETDHDFFNRLLEDDGIFYFYKRTQSEHTIVLGDSANAYDACVATALNRFSPLNQHDAGDDILGWEHGFDFRPGRWAQRDYNFQTPANPLGTERHLSTKQDGGDPYEMFAFPGGYQVKGDGDRLTRVRMEAEDCAYDVVHASTTCPDLCPGGRFKVGKHPIKDEEGTEWLVTRVEHSAREGFAYETGATAEFTYSNGISCIPSKVVFRPARRTPRPVMHGIQTAVVVGPSGEEIYVDKYGRVKVHFHWDRHSGFDEKASCWIRVAQPWAGAGYGGLAIPRIGQEVVVEFEEGNPDRPLINGRVYNEAQQVPVSNAGRPGAAPSDITKAAMMTTIRSNSLGKSGGYNELTMDDTKGRETLFIHAEKDNLNKIKHDQSTVIGNDRKESVGKSHTEAIGTDYTLTVGKTLTETVDGDAAISIKKNRTETVGADSTMKIKGNETTSVGGEVKIEIGKDMTVKVGGAGKLEVTKALEISAQEITIKAMTKIEIAVGSSKITLEPAQVTIEGVMIATKASAINEVKGALVKIN